MYFLCSIVVAIISYFLFKRSGADMNPRGVNMLSWIYYVQFICFSLIGATCAVYAIDNHYIISSIHNNQTTVRFIGWLMVLYSMVAFPLGILIVKKMFSMRYVLRHDNSYYIIYKYPLLYIFTILSIASCLYVLYESHYIGLLNIITGTASAQTRINYVRNFAGNEYIRNIFAQTLSILLSMAWYIEWKTIRKSKAKLFFYIMIFFAVLMTTQSFAKAPIINLFISFVMLRIYLFGRLSRKFWITSVILSCLGIVIMYIKVTGVDLSAILNSYNTGILGRVFFSQIAGLFKTLEFFPSEHAFIGFSSISRLIAQLLGNEYTDRSARIVMEIFNPRGVSNGTAGVMNSLFIAEAWANWGMIGAVLSPWITGVVTGVIYYITVNNRNLVYGAVYGYLSLKIPITGGFNDFIYPVGLLLPFFIIFLITKIKLRRYIPMYCKARKNCLYNDGDHRSN